MIRFLRSLEARLDCFGYDHPVWTLVVSIAAAMVILTFIGFVPAVLNEVSEQETSNAVVNVEGDPADNGNASC